LVRSRFGIRNQTQRRHSRRPRCPRSRHSLYGSYEIVDIDPSDERLDILSADDSADEGLTTGRLERI
jgi:hypothetical protein